MFASLLLFVCRTPWFRVNSVKNIITATLLAKKNRVADMGGAILSIYDRSQRLQYRKHGNLYLKDVSEIVGLFQSLKVQSSDRSHKVQKLQL